MHVIKTVAFTATLAVAAASTASAIACGPHMHMCRQADGSWDCCFIPWAVEDPVAETCPPDTQVAGRFGNGTVFCTADGKIPTYEPLERFYCGPMCHPCVDGLCCCEY